MQNITRSLKNLILKRLANNPAVALLGARQVGKSTLAKEIVSKNSNAIYLDLELDSDLNKIINDPELFLSLNCDKLICLDEIQHAPEIFKTLRGIIDRNNRNSQFLLLGSASRDLIRQSSESLAGRIAYLEVDPFSRSEIIDYDFFQYWIRGGYPKSLLASDLEESISWRSNYIQTFLERDLPSLGFRIPAVKLKRMWTMLAHSQGQVANYAKLGASLDLSIHTVKHYIDILEQTFLIHVLKPFHNNTKKRLVKSPKIFIRDTGILHSLLKINELNDLLGHPVLGNSFETLVIQNILLKYSDFEASFYRDSSGNEIDLILEKGNNKIAIEIKASTAPKLEKGFWNSVKFIKPDQMWLIAQVDSTYPGKDGVIITNLDEFLKNKIS